MNPLIFGFIKRTRHRGVRGIGSLVSHCSLPKKIFKNRKTVRNSSDIVLKMNGKFVWSISIYLFACIVVIIAQYEESMVDPFDVSSVAKNSSRQF